MRKLVIALLFAGIAAAAGVANGNSEKLTTVEGTVVSVERVGTVARVMVETRTREMVMVEVPAGELERLAIRVQSRIRAEGVYLGVPQQQREQTQEQARLLARTVNAGSGGVNVEAPLRLTTRDRQQLRQWKRQQDRLLTQTQTQTQTQTNKP